MVSLRYVIIPVTVIRVTFLTFRGGKQGLSDKYMGEFSSRGVTQGRGLGKIILLRCDSSFVRALRGSEYMNIHVLICIKRWMLLG